MSLGTVAGPITLGHAGGLHIQGGKFTHDIRVERGNDLTIYGTRFALPPTGDGPEIDLTSLLSPNVPYLLETRDTTLTATLADGSPFELDLFTFPVPGRDFVDVDARVFLVLVQVPEPGTLLFALVLVPLACMTRGSFRM